MMEKNFEQALKEYLDKTMAMSSAYSDATLKNWAFGAIDFAYTAGLIKSSTMDVLYKDYELVI